MAAKREEHVRLTRHKLAKRMELGAERPDVIEGQLRPQDEFDLSRDQLQANSEILIVAGSETTATLLSGVTYLRGTHPNAMARLVCEVRTSFKSQSEIHFTSVSNLQYMLACLDEALRLYPPLPLGLLRVTPKGGAMIAGHEVTENTTVSLYHYAVYHSEKFFALSEEFHPERWLGDPRFANDDRAAFQPFSLGPRNCIGWNLAYVEMRLILARLLWNFDLKLAEDSQNWVEKQSIYIV